MGQMEDLELGSESLPGGQKGLPREGDPEVDLDVWERVFQAERMAWGTASEAQGSVEGGRRSWAGRMAVVSSEGRVEQWPHLMQTSILNMVGGHLLLPFDLHTDV